MKFIKLIIVIFTLILFASSICISGEYKAKQPILITSSGQSADILMAKILAQKAGLNFTLDKLAKPEMLTDKACLIIVSGGSTKGLGAAKIDKEQELKRVQDLIQAAKEAKLSIITMHLGGMARRGKLSDEFNKLAAENADCLIVVKTGDEDQFFSKIAEGKKIPVYLIDKILAAGDVLKEIFGE